MSADLILLLPEIVLLTLACIALLVDTIWHDPQHRSAYWLAQLGLVATALLIIFMTPLAKTFAFDGLFVSDAMSVVLKFTICLFAIMALIYSREYLGKHGLLKGEYFVLALTAVLGMLVMTSAHNLLTIYLGLELLSLSLYAMVAMHRDSSAAAEAAMKYFILGALASGMLLYGMSMLYGLSGSLDLAVIAAHLQADDGGRVLQSFALVFILIGVAFKLGAVPFHMWVPDVYQGAPTSVTLFIGSAPKLAAFAMAMRLFVDGMAPLVSDWQTMLMILAVLSMAVGNLVAIAQTNIKRMLAYSTIAHVGFLLLGLAAGTAGGYAGSMFYVMTYALMSMGGFAMIILLGSDGREADQLDDFRGLSDRSPWLALMMLILMFSMAGVPPFLGFWAKWFVLQEVIAAGHVWLALVAVAFAIVGAFYYLRVIKLMYFDAAESDAQLVSSLTMRVTISSNGLALLLLGLSPGLLMSVCLYALGS
ncbi:MAG: NADH-quinone oxidoreductase subunit NuoN [Gammaproteobacteria bacterium]